MIVILRPIQKHNWSGGLIKYRNCYEDIAPYYTRSGGIYTGLTKADEVRLGEILGKDLGRGSDFWKTFFIRTSTKDLYLNIDDPIDELKYLFIKNHKRVKNSLLEHKAGANFVLINKDEEAKRSNLYNKIKRKANSEFDKLTAEDIKKVLRLFGHNADTMSAEVAENRLFEIVDGNPQGFLDKWVNNDLREVEVLLERAISRNIIRKNKSIYKFGSDIIAHSKQQALDYLNNPKNQDIRLTILKEVDGKGSSLSAQPKTKSEKNIKKLSKDTFVSDEVSKTPISKNKGDTI